MIKLLEQGDIIRLEIGMRVYAYLPEYIFSRSGIFLRNPIKHAIMIGEQFYNSAITREGFIRQIEEHPYFYLGEQLSYKDIDSYLNSLRFNFDTQKYDTSFYAGVYIVNNCSYDGASVVDLNSKGYHVFCNQITNPEIKVEFYQTGLFTAMIREIQPIDDIS